MLLSVICIHKDHRLSLFLVEWDRAVMQPRLLRSISDKDKPIFKRIQHVWHICKLHKVLKSGVREKIELDFFLSALFADVFDGHVAIKLHATTLVPFAICYLLTFKKRMFRYVYDNNPIYTSK